VLYLSQKRLMLESEHAINDNASHGPVIIRRVCTQLLSEPTRYARWRVRHERRMGAVADARLRQPQILALRAFALEQIHGSALVRYLREQGVIGEARDRRLRDFFGVLDSREAALMAHRDYLLAASSQVCAMELLDLANDGRGIELLVEYEQAYGHFFTLFCESSRTDRSEPYLLSSLLPEVRTLATKLRRRILESDSRRTRRAQLERLVRDRTLGIQSYKLVRHPRTS
jgi:hypothetical protein